MVMALDVGSKRIGVAIADPSGTFALPLATIARTNLGDDLAQIAQYMQSYAVDELVVGDPLTLSGERGIAAHAIDAFVDELRAIFAVMI
ncbi:MAG: Holliday junction resolvase RuvX, partial [Candidatus Eremiobacteraeota bacterium]|nr:Holliday junction resolvase RuvX [Candidatus Eremiobacteraeota bacterium]